MNDYNQSGPLFTSHCVLTEKKHINLIVSQQERPKNARMRYQEPLLLLFFLKEPTMWQICYMSGPSQGLKFLGGQSRHIVPNPSNSNRGLSVLMKRPRDDWPLSFFDKFKYPKLGRKT